MSVFKNHSLFDSHSRRAAPRGPLDESDRLVWLATRQDPDAVAALIIGFGPMLLEEALAVLGPSREHAAPDAVQDFAEELLGGDVPRFKGGRGEGIPFLRRIMRGSARPPRTRRHPSVSQ